MFKRAFDLIVLGVTAPLWLPLLAIVAGAVRVGLGSPVLFRQSRPGLGGRVFGLYKFRTMTDGRDARGQLLPDADRMTKFGSFLRAASLDELPSLLNVVKGEMALVGPRPLLVQYLALYSPEQARRHEAVPGLTGWAQVNGRNALSWEEKFALDVWYVDHQSVRLDMYILLLTVLKVVRREDISQDGSATMPAFQGSEQDIKQRPGT